MSEVKKSGSTRTGRNLLLVGLVVIALLLLANLLTGRGEEHLEVAQETGGATAAEVRLQLSVTELELDTAAGPGLLLEGQAGSRGRERLTESFTLRSGVAAYRLTSRSTGPAFLQNHRPVLWDLHLNPSLPTDLRVKAGVGRIDLELRDALLTRLELELGVGTATVTLPQEFTSEASVPVDISAGVGELALRIPLSAPLRVRIETGLGAANVSSDLERDGSTYSSPSYLPGAPALEVQIQGGVGSVNVTTY